MKCVEIEKILNGTGWLEYCSNWYEYIGESDDGRHVFSDVNDGHAILVSDKALRNSSEFFFTEVF